jgi:hypothetical protein
MLCVDGWHDRDEFVYDDRDSVDLISGGICGTEARVMSGAGNDAHWNVKDTDNFNAVLDTGSAMQKCA